MSFEKWTEQKKQARLANAIDELTVRIVELTELKEKLVDLFEQFVGHSTRQE